MTLRLFTCRSCGHHMRFSGRVCHACFQNKATWQHPFTSIGVAATGVALVLTLAAQSLTE